ncbi:ABSCISIC ACID-INSENSITIVE 5-like protein 7 [Cornus florida]|uniref:ABSCISIC ACID-INSENSITIVE 5-like protein 7 n=1 Tax=Cornus florida TaxID=4283 RepID=UPI0028966700|nr:ABSCISIC ACID-INSENSITIVE 5-like protein 7 [Cornus florida]
MGSYINFKNFNSTPQPESSGGKPVGNFPLARQSSIYSLTFDELQNSMGGVGKDFGSMNMDELLKNIWTAEEMQAMASFPNGTEGSTPGGNLQKQGSLSLPRTLSQKTVDEVWRDLLKESGSAKDGGGSGGSNLPQRQQTLGEMTLEEFLVRAGIVREDTQPIARQTNGGFYGEISRPGNSNTGLTLGFQQPTRNNGVLANHTTENNNLVPNQSSSLGLNVGGARSCQLQQQQQQLQQQQQQQLFPKQATLAFASPMHLVNNGQLASPGTRGAVVGMADPPMNNALVQSAVIQSGAVSMAGLGSANAIVAAGSPVNQLPTDVNSKSNINTSSLSPVSYMFSEGTRGRKGNGGLEKVVERRHRRMIKNRESAARSRARKQAYTLELEAEVAKLKEINQDLQKKQAEIMEMQKNQISEAQKMPWGSKRLCLRRTLTGPW